MTAVTFTGTLFADPTMSRERKSSRRNASLPEERCYFVLVLGRHREIAVVAEERLARHVMGAFHAGDPMTVTGFMSDAEWTSRAGHKGREVVLYADSIIRYAQRRAAS